MDFFCYCHFFNLLSDQYAENSKNTLFLDAYLYYNKESNLQKLCVCLASYMVSLGKGISYEEANNMVLDAIRSKKAYNKFLEFVLYQHGDITKLPKSNKIYEVKSDISGYLTDISSLEIAKLSMHLGAGRQNKDDKIDYSAGIIINKNINDYVNINDTILTLYTNKDVPLFDKNKLFKISDNINNDNSSLIYEIIK